jgi:hypothetical protein
MPVIELKQKHVEAFYHAIPQDLTAVELFRDMLRNSGAIVRAAQKAKWFETDPGDVDELAPGAVLELAKEVTAAYGEAIAVSPS